MSARPRPASVHYHSIVGDHLDGDDRHRDTGWPAICAIRATASCPTQSAHIDNAESELEVPADHFHVHHHPLAIQEVRRILLEHYQGFIRHKDGGKELQLMSSGSGGRGHP